MNSNGAQFTAVADVTPGFPMLSKQTVLPQMISRILGQHKWALADQALVSSMNFLTAAMLARMLGIIPYGIFAVYYVILLYLNSIQLALISAPMMTLAPQIHGYDCQRDYLRGMAGLQYLFALASGMLALFGAALGTRYLKPNWFHAGLAFPFALTVVCFQCQDWLRRFYYLHDKGKAVFINDLISYGGQIIVLLLLFQYGLISISSVFHAIAITSLIAFSLGLITEQLLPSLEQIRKAFRRSWALGRSLLAASQFQWLGSQGVLLIGALVVGVRAASGVRAVITVLGPVNVLLQMIDNVVPVRAAHAYMHGGRLGLVRYLGKTSLFLLLVMSLPVSVIVIFAKPIMVLAFGSAFTVFAGLIVWQGAYCLLGLAYRHLQYYYRTIGNAQVLARAALVTAIVVTFCCFVFAKLHGVVGVMVALVIGQCINVAWPLMFAFQTLLPIPRWQGNNAPDLARKDTSSDL